MEGIADFKGKLLHSARWDNSYSFEGKKVAVIGNGSSGVQIVPNLGPSKHYNDADRKEPELTLSIRSHV